MHPDSAAQKNPKPIVEYEVLGRRCRLRRRETGPWPRWSGSKRWCADADVGREDFSERTPCLCLTTQLSWRCRTGQCSRRLPTTPNVKFRVLTLFPSQSRDGSYCLALSSAVIKKLIGMFHIARVGFVSCSISCRVIWRKMLEGYKEARATTIITARGSAAMTAVCSPLPDPERRKKPMTNASDDKCGAPEGAGCGSSLASWPAAREGGALSVRPRMLPSRAVVRKRREKQKRSKTE